MGFFFFFFLALAFVLFCFKPESLSTEILGILLMTLVLKLPQGPISVQILLYSICYFPTSVFACQSVGKSEFKGEAHLPQVRTQSFPPRLLKAKTGSHKPPSVLDSAPWGLFCTLSPLPSLWPAPQSLSLCRLHCQL